MDLICFVNVVSTSLFGVARAGRFRRGGACETTEDCVAPNVCSKWGWCQWTKIYGEDGPRSGN